MKIVIQKVEKVPLWKIWRLVSRDEVTYTVNGEQRKSVLYDAENSPFLLVHYVHNKALGAWFQFKYPLDGIAVDLLSQFKEKFPDKISYDEDFDSKITIEDLYGKEFILPDEPVYPVEPMEEEINESVQTSEEKGQ